MNNKKIGIVGSGIIGKNWAMLFAAEGFNVFLYDIIDRNVDKALVDIKDQLKNFEKQGLLRGQLTVEQQMSLIKKADSLSHCVKDTIHVQECVNEVLEDKKQIFKQMDEFVTSKSTVLCSSTSHLMPSLFSESMKHRNQVIVGHPVNPTYIISIVELIPTKWTDDFVIKQTNDLFLKIGQKPIIFKKEVIGFGVNRIQFAILNECWRLIDDGVLDVESVDEIMAHGLGLPYAFQGPWEVAHTNANGVEDYFKRFGKAIYDVSMDFGPVPKFQGKTAKLIADKMNKLIPVDKVEERRKWRDEMLIKLIKLKKEEEK